MPGSCASREAKREKKGDENEEDEEPETSDDKAAAEEIQRKIEGYLDSIGPMGFTLAISGSIKIIAQ